MKEIIVNFVGSNILIMNTTEIKDYLHKQIDELDDRLLNAIYAMLQSYTQEGKPDVTLSPEQIKELERRKQRHISGESKSYSWKEVKARIKQ